jgi:hypothetical protein
MAITINEEVVSKSGVKFPRAYSAGLSYRHGETPFLEWFQEMLTVFSDGTTVSEPHPIPKIASQFDAELTYPLLNPMTGETIGVGSDQVLFAHLFSRWHYDLLAAEAAAAEAIQNAASPE